MSEIPGMHRPVFMSIMDYLTALTREATEYEATELMRIHERFNELLAASPQAHKPLQIPFETHMDTEETLDALREAAYSASTEYTFMRARGE